jgi:hypothetical protein
VSCPDVSATIDKGIPALSLIFPRLIINFLLTFLFVVFVIESGNAGSDEAKMGPLRGDGPRLPRTHHPQVATTHSSAAGDDQAALPHLYRTLRKR